MSAVAGWRHRPRQSGIVLFVSLIVLVLLALFAIAVANNAIEARKNADDVRGRQLVELAADSALVEAKRRIAATAAIYGGVGVCAHLHCVERTPGTPDGAAALLETESAKAAMNNVSPDFGRAQVRPMDRQASAAYLIEVLDVRPPDIPPSSSTAKPDHAFRIIARGVVGAGNQVRIAETVYSVAP